MFEAMTNHLTMPWVKIETSVNLSGRKRGVKMQGDKVVVRIKRRVVRGGHLLHTLYSPYDLILGGSGEFLDILNHPEVVVHEG